MEVEKDESGFYFGTTSIGYVLAIVLIALPVCVLVIKEVISLWVGLLLLLLGTVFLCLLLYPIMLCWVLAGYFVIQAHDLPANRERPPDKE